MVMYANTTVAAKTDAYILLYRHLYLQQLLYLHRCSCRWDHTLFEAQPITLSWTSLVCPIHPYFGTVFWSTRSTSRCQQVPSHIVVGAKVLCKYNSVQRSSRDFSSLILTVASVLRVLPDRCSIQDKNCLSARLLAVGRGLLCVSNSHSTISARAKIMTL